MADSFADRASALREAFDHSFTLARAGAAEAAEALLAIRVRREPFALRVAELDGIAAARAIVPVKSARAGLLGIAGIRGELVPVFDLAALLGYPGEGERPGWIALAGREERFGLAFAELEGHLTVPRAELAAPATPGGHRGPVLHLAGAPRATLSIVSIAAALHLATKEP